MAPFASTQALQPSPYSQDITDCLITPLRDGFDEGFKDDPVAFMTSPPTKSVNAVSRQGSAKMHSGNAPSQEDLQRAFAQYNSFAVSNGAPTKQYATVPPITSDGNYRSMSEGSTNAIISPIPLTPGFTQRLREMCQNGDVDSQLNVAQPQLLSHQQPYGASNVGSHVSGMRLGPERSQSAVQVPRDSSNVAQLTRLHTELLRQLHAANLESNGIQTHSVTPEPDAQHMNTSATGLMRSYRPSIPSVPARAISQPVNNPRNPQPSIKDAEERQPMDGYEDLAAHGMAEEQGSSPAGKLIYASFDEALASQQPVHQVDPSADKTFPSTLRARRRYVVQLISAMYDVSEATDSEKVKKAWQEFLGTDHRGIEVTSWILMESTVRAHQQKEPLVAPRSKNSKGKTKFASFQEHINAICHGMRQHKTICQHLMAPDYTDGYIDNPIAGADRVGNNRKVNLKKKQTIDRGRLAEQHSRQTSELPAMQRQNTQPYRQPSYQPTLPSTEHDDPELEVTQAKHYWNPDSRPKVAKSKKRKSTEVATNSSCKKSKTSRRSNFPIQQGADGRHYVLDKTSEQYPVQLSHSHPNAFTPVNHESTDSNLVTHTSNVTMPEPFYSSLNHPDGQIHQHSFQVQQSFNEQDFEQSHIQNDDVYQQTFDGAGCDEGDFDDEDLDVQENEVAEYGCAQKGVNTEPAGYNVADYDEADHVPTQHAEPPCDEPVHHVPVQVEPTYEEPVRDDPAYNKSPRERPNLAPLIISNKAVEAPLTSTYHDLKSGGYSRNPLSSAQLIDSLFNGDLPDFADFGPPTPTNDFESQFLAMVPDPGCAVNLTTDSFFANDLALPQWNGGDEDIQMDGTGSFFS